MRYWTKPQIRDALDLRKKGHNSAETAALLAKKYPKELTGCTRNMVIGAWNRWREIYDAIDKQVETREARRKEYLKRIEKQTRVAAVIEGRQRRAFSGKCVLYGCTNTAQPGRDHCATHISAIKVDPSTYKNRPQPVS